MNTEDFDINFDDIEEENDELCPSIQMFTGLIVSDKPLGIFYPREEQVEFLKTLGYKIFEKPNEDIPDIPIQVAVKKSDGILPDMNESNINETFNKEVRRILLKWLLKIDND